MLCLFLSGKNVKFKQNPTSTNPLFDWTNRSIYMLFKSIAEYKKCATYLESI